MIQAFKVTDYADYPELIFNITVGFCEFNEDTIELFLLTEGPSESIDRWRGDFSKWCAAENPNFLLDQIVIEKNLFRILMSPEIFICFSIKWVGAKCLSETLLSLIFELNGMVNKFVLRKK